MVSRRAVVSGIAGAASLGAITGAMPAWSQAAALPNPITIYVGYPAGGGLDMVARLLAEQLKSSLGTTVIVENRVGALGSISAEAVRRAKPDGASILLVNSPTMVLAPLTMEAVKYDPIKDFVQIARLCDFPGACVASNATGAKTLSELLAWMKANPDKANYGTAGAGSYAHIWGSILGRAAALQLTHVPYRGGAPLMNDVVAGHMPCGMTTAADVIEQHRSGALRIVAVTGTRRSPVLPDVPTFAEQGIAGIEQNGWVGAFLPPGTPNEITERIAQAMTTGVNDPTVTQKLNAQAFDINVLSAAAFREELSRERQIFQELIKLL